MTENKTLHREKVLRDLIFLAIVVSALLLPFSDKAFHIDDPLFLWAAKHIQTDPFDFYGFDVNWYGFEEPMYRVMKNPPITSYLIALITKFFGWSERVIHIFLVLPAIAVSWATYLLARRMTALPLLAALAGVVTPVFLVSSTTVMSDVLMLAFWVWAVFLWVRGTEEGRPLFILVSVLLIAVSAMTKYFGMSLLMLLPAYSLGRRERIASWLPWMLIPVFVLALYQWATSGMYGKGLLLDIAPYAAGSYVSSGFIGNGIVGLFFLGGSVITALFFTPFLWSWGKALVVLALAGLSVIGVSWLGLFPAGAGTGLLLFHSFVFAAAGITVVALAAGDLMRRRDASSLLLFLWVAGTFVFASFLNWSNNGRSILPLVPAAGILLSRSLEEFKKPQTKKLLFAPLAPALVLSLAVTWGDYALANSVRSAASHFSEQYLEKGIPLWFQGHYGFQYYMEENGARPVDWGRFDPEEAAVVVNPVKNTNVEPLPENYGLLEEFTLPASPGVTVMSYDLVANFYSSAGGPVPYIIGKTEEEIYYVSIRRRK